MWPYLLAAGSTLLGMQAGRRAGEAEVGAGSEDLTSALVAGSFRDRGLSEKRDRALSRIRARTGASGVELAGSALEVFTNAAGQAARDLIVSRIATEREVAVARERIRGGAARAQGAVTGGLLELGALGLDYAKTSGLRYKAPKTTRFSDSDLQIYGWD
ncbi:MAG: hypothetical protein A2Z40_03215 [Deltaproteobacteria bacterium RBG_19FT_COMBO_60_16]|nr:MAG: hypothetical protein A2Z40_03215 [Deltaproteobacteria bacterium RBG_19FT_COMBO_60_16]